MKLSILKFYKTYFILNKILILVLLFSILFTCELSSQTTFHRLFNELYGLNYKLINDITKDHKDIVWLATERGLVKFDGLTFCEIVPDLLKYKLSEIISIKSKGNLLFLQYKNKGCLTYNLDNFKFKEIYNKNFVSIEPITESSYFLITEDGHLLKYSNNTSKLIYSFGSKFNICSSTIFNKYLYLANSFGVFKFDTSSLSLVIKNNKIKITYNVEFNPSSYYLNLITNNSVYRIDSIGNRQYNKEIIFNKLNIPENVSYYSSESKNRYVYIYNQKKVIFGEIKNAVDLRFVLDLDNIKTIQFRKIFIYDKYNSLIGTNQGLLWLSKQKNGFHKLKDSKYFDEILRVRRSIIELDKNELLFFGYPSVIKYDLNTKKYKTLLSNSTFYNAILIKDRFYITTHNLGFVRYNRDFSKIQTIYNPPKTYNVFIGLCYDSINNIIAAGGKNCLIFYYVNRNIKRVYNLEIGLIKSIIKDDINNVFWIGTKKGLFGVDLNGKIIYNFADNPKLLNHRIFDVSDLLIINNSELYISSYSGVYKLNLRYISSNYYKLPIHEDLVKNSVGLEYDKHGKIWISTYQGLLIYDINTQFTTHLVQDIHILNNEFNHSSSHALSDGSLIFGGIDGYDLIYPNKIDYRYLDNNLSISTIFKFSKNDTIQLSTDNYKSIKFKIGQEFLKINVNIKNKIHDNTYRFEYSFDDNVWIKGNSTNQILILDLSPGKHKLKIRSLEKITKANIIELDIIATLPFYKSIHFAWLVTLIILILFLLYIFTLRKIKSLRVKLKNQIAMDLHDEVGTVLTRALFQSRKQENNDISNLIETALNSLRAYLHTMIVKFVSLTDLIDDISEMLNFIIIDENIKVNFQYPDYINYSISSLLYRDLKLTFYEIFANIQKHAHSTEIYVKIECERNYLIIKISDNGVFNDVNILRNNGNGIDNIKKRIIRHKGDIKFSVNAVGSGLKIKIKVPYKL